MNPHGERNRTEERHHNRLLVELTELELWNRYRKLKERQIPEEWRRIAREAALPQKKVPVTARLDADLVKWFRSQGRGYQGRMNRVLRAYMLSLLAKEITGEDDHDWKGDRI
jgi:uncharacterized protein (DUF4415 family)